MTRAERLAMIRAAHRRTQRANRYADHVAITARDDHDVPCVIGLDKNPVRVFIEHNEYNGRVTERVSNVSKGNGGARASTVDQGALKKFGAQMRAAVMAAAGRANGAQAPARQPTPARAPAKPRGFAPEVAEDDVPF